MPGDKLLGFSGDGVGFAGGITYATEGIITVELAPVSIVELSNE